MVDVIIFIHFPTKGLFGYANYYTQEKCITNVNVFDEDEFCWYVKDFHLDYPLLAKSEVKIEGISQNFLIKSELDDYGFLST